MKNLRLACLTAFGLEGVAKSELNRMGYADAETENGRVTLRGDFSDAARLNVSLRSVDRVVILLAEFPAKTFDELFEGASKIDFPFPKDARIMVSGKSVKSVLSAFEVCASVVKKAVINRICERFGLSKLDGETEFKLTVSVRGDVAEIYLDTSGQGLSFRGYRKLNGEAALRETLAASLILLSRYRGDRPLVDPFCGTGTIPIEAAMIANEIPPNLGRTFDFEKWSGLVRSEDTEAVRAELRSKRSDRPVKIFGFDIDPNAVSMANYHAKLAGVSVHFQVRDVRQLASAQREGVVVTNPPYGERISDKREARELLGILSSRFRALGDWSLLVITPERDFERISGLACKKRKLYNGGIECTAYQSWKK